MIKIFFIIFKRVIIKSNNKTTIDQIKSISLQSLQSLQRNKKSLISTVIPIKNMIHKMKY